MTKYTFRTIVAPDEVRADFTVLRDRLNSSDKELMQAFWNFAMSNVGAIEDEVKHLQEQAALVRAEKQVIKAAAKLREKEAKLMKTEIVSNEEEEDDFETVVVDGTN